MIKQKLFNGRLLCLVGFALAAPLVVGLLFQSFGSYAIAKNSIILESELWSKIASGEYVVMLRHALAPGTSDPDSFNLSDCATQRNLSHEGREQSKRIGDRFRENGIVAAAVYTSQWCRCIDTARLLNLGPVSELPALNSLHARNERRDLQTKQLKNWFTKQENKKPIVFVSHRATISAFTGEYPDSGEMVIVSVTPSGDYSVVGRIHTPW